MSNAPWKRYLRRVTRHHLAQDILPSRLKHLIADLFRPDIAEPDTISDHARLIDGDLGLDSLDALELALCLEEEFGLTLHHGDDSYRAFASISSLAGFIRLHTQAGSSRQNSPARVRILQPKLTALALG